jgi:prophage maintenance system killer protein
MSFFTGKRVALMATLNFLAQNEIVANEEVPGFYDALIGLAEKRLDKRGLADVFRTHLSP